MLLFVTPICIQIHCVSLDFGEFGHIIMDKVVNPLINEEQWL
jgi:hypothetical protein